MGCTEIKSDDEYDEEERPNHRYERPIQNYQEEESIIEEEEFKDFEELGSKIIN